MRFNHRSLSLLKGGFDRLNHQGAVSLMKESREQKKESGSPHKSSPRPADPAKMMSHVNLLSGNDRSRSQLRLVQQISQKTGGQAGENTDAQSWK